MPALCQPLKVECHLLATLLTVECGAKISQSAKYELSGMGLLVAFALLTTDVVCSESLPLLMASSMAPTLLNSLEFTAPSNSEALPFLSRVSDNDKFVEPVGCPTSWYRLFPRLEPG